MRDFPTSAGHAQQRKEMQSEFLVPRNNARGMRLPPSNAFVIYVVAYSTISGVAYASNEKA